jgi:hypothetical protein
MALDMGTLWTGFLDLLNLAFGNAYLSMLVLLAIMVYGIISLKLDLGTSVFVGLFGVLVLSTIFVVSGSWILGLVLFFVAVIFALGFLRLVT